jgi:hypothetical protein
MAVNDFTGSIAQTQLSFTTTSVVTTIVGQNFVTPILFIDTTEWAANSSATNPGVGFTFSFTAANYQANSTGVLLSWLTAFFAINQVTTVIAAVYSGIGSAASVATAQTALNTAWANVVNLGYFKMIFASVNEVNSTLVDTYHWMVRGLAVQCYGNQQLSSCWIGTNNAQELVGSSTTSLSYTIRVTDGGDAKMVYHADNTKNHALTQLALTLATINGTGVAVGNPDDYIQTLSEIPSGVAGAVVTSAQQANFVTTNVGYWNYVGDGTGAVALVGLLTIRGNTWGAGWLIAYTNYVSQVQTADFITQPGAPTFKTNQTYQGILGIMQKNVLPFQTQMANPRLSNFKVTAPQFAALPVTAGTNITIPNAWQANYNNRVGSVTVNSTLYINA